MKTEKRFLTGVTIAAIFTVLACSKEKIADNSISESITASSSIAEAKSICSQFSYGDTIFYPAELPNDYIIHLVAPLAGTFGAYPDGLEIDPFTGDIDITESETGLKYLVWFAPAGSRDTCKKFLYVSGVNFADSVYVLKNNPAMASPIYNASLLTPTQCNGDCEFDDGHDDDDGDGFADEPPVGQEVIPQGIAMDKKTGGINLKQTITNGALGANPISGAVKDFILNYRISDRSAKALNKTTLRLYYYKTQREIPAKLRRDLAIKKQWILLNNIRDPYAVPYTVEKISTAKNGAGEVKCRPPYIIVVQK